MAVELASDRNFKEQLSSNEKVVVKYFAGWCGSCRLIAPKYKRLSNDERFEGITFLEVDAEASPEARKMANVSNLPHFAVFEKGDLVEAVNTSKEDAVVDLLGKLGNN